MAEKEANEEKAQQGEKTQDHFRIGKNSGQ
jgi:hypothetical protein